MNAFNSKGYKKHLLPYLESEVARIKDFDEMEEFFDCYFLVGRRDDMWNDSSYKHAPYPHFERISMNELQIAALCETDKNNVKKVLQLVLKHSGRCTSSKKDEFLGVRYTPTFTYEDYQKSLTFEDSFLIYEDIQRLQRVHG